MTVICVIGTGPCGLFSIFQCGMAGMRCYVFESMPVMGGQCLLYPEKPIYDIPAYPQISAQDLINNLKKQNEPFDPIYHLGEQVMAIQDVHGGGFTVKGSKGTTVTVDAVIIAAGMGAFAPKKPPLENIEQFEQTSVFYHIAQTDHFQDKCIVIAGGGDSATDWAIELSKKAKQIYIIHRRANFTCHRHTMEKIQNTPNIALCTPYQVVQLHGNPQKLECVTISHIETKQSTTIACDFFLPFFGQASHLGPILNWDVGVVDNAIPVMPLTMETQRPFIFAVGDVATYPHKIKLIVTGFAEAAQASRTIAKRINPDIKFRYSTVTGTVQLKA